MRCGRDLRSVGLSRRVVCALLVAFAAACASPQLDRRPLYEQLGGEAGLAALVDRFLHELARDADAAPQFRGVDVKRFRIQLTLHLCQTFDGPCRYEGAPLAEVHRGMQISQREFNAVVEDLVRAMESLRIPTPVQNRVLARLAPMREQVVGQAHPGMGARAAEAPGQAPRLDEQSFVR
ncbi:MAG: group 1 truncated hemoglobin [Deltaproteobacteria bacterium]|nr:group 1 truncated hemoglobin [Deltaproteobacteria bacterium]